MELSDTPASKGSPFSTNWGKNSRNHHRRNTIHFRCIIDILTTTNSDLSLSKNRQGTTTAKGITAKSIKEHNSSLESAKSR